MDNNHKFNSKLLSTFIENNKDLKKIQIDKKEILK
jgi:hypothetical protein